VWLDFTLAGQNPADLKLLEVSVKNFTIAVMCLVAVSVLAPSAFGQCPAEPLNAFAGTWVFHTEGVSFWGSAAVGKITATVGANKAGQPQGVLNVIESSNFTGPGGNGLLNRFLTYQGIYTMFNDCSGGTLMLNSNFNQHLQYDFYFRPSATGLEIVMVSISGPSFNVPVPLVNQFTFPLQYLIQQVQPVFAGQARKIA